MADPLKPRKLRVLVLSPSVQKTGGVANYVRVTRDHSPHQLDLVVRGSRPGERSGRGVLSRLARDYFMLGSRLFGSRPDVVHQNTSFGRAGLLRDAVFAAMAKARGCRLVIFFHGWDRAFEARMGWAERALLRVVYFRADAIIVLATRSRERLLEWGYRGPVYIETTLVEDEMLQVGLKRSPSASRALRILFMARLERAKGIYDAIDVFLKLRERGAAVELLIAGDGTEREAVERYVAERGAAGIRCLGHVSGAAKAEALDRADVYLLTSHGEGLPTTLLEAMAAGLPVVTSAVGGIPDIFDEGRMGFMIPPHDLEGFVEAVRRLLADIELRHTMGEYNRAVATERFAASRVVARVGAIYEAVAALPADPALR